MASSESLNISELFYSIQGESSYAGYPCIFIRLSGCNLRCSYCDATYTYEEQGTLMDLQQILDFVDSYSVRLVQITGGEPLLQEAVYPLMQNLVERQRVVLLETNGSLSLAHVPAGVIKIMDVKCPGSNMADKLHLANIALLARHDEVKFVLSSEADYEWARTFIQTHFSDNTGKQQQTAILFSPVQPQLQPSDLAEWLLRDQLPVRLQLQLHTQLWPNETRGF
ncbi:MAG: radical SAM protein [Desulfobulbaceae bacterium]|nr:radical SAM protein [Desulfobulbaceae bacterium]